MVSACHPAYSSPLPGRKALSISCTDQAEPSGLAQMSRGLSVRHRFGPPFPSDLRPTISRHTFSDVHVYLCLWGVNLGMCIYI